MQSEFRYFLTCSSCGVEKPEGDFKRRAEQRCPVCDVTEIEPAQGGGFDRYFESLSLTTSDGYRFEVRACAACIDFGKAIAKLRELVEEQRKSRPRYTR